MKHGLLFLIILVTSLACIFFIKGINLLEKYRNYEILKFDSACKSGAGFTWSRADFVCNDGKTIHVSDDAAYCRNETVWKKNISFYCGVADKGAWNRDPCFKYKSLDDCDANYSRNGYQGGDCGWYMCSNRCLTKGTPMDMGCK